MTQFSYYAIMKLENDERGIAMQHFRNQDEDLNTVLEHGNYYGAGKDRDEDAASVNKDQVSLQILLIGMFACFILPLVIADLVLVAALGSLLILLASVRLWKEGKLIRWVFATAVIQTIWRIVLVVFSYIPQLSGSLVVMYVGFGFIALGLAQLVLLCIALRKIQWIGTASKIPAALIGYVLLFGVSFVPMDVMFVVRALIAALVGLYLRDVYNYSDIKNA